MISHDDRDPVDVLAEEFAERIRRGERPSINDYAVANPGLADQLREILPAVAQMEQLKRLRMATPKGGGRSLPTRLGDFRIVRELGRGGMGVVFEAVQESLGRAVALKVLSAHSQLNAVRRERFVREAKAAARLHHTNIVPVFGVGEHDGLPYYVMQLIHGRGLNTVLDGWRRAGDAETENLLAGSMNSTAELDESSGQPVREQRDEVEVDAAGGGAPAVGDWAFVAELGVQVADALQYAHEKGVLHRDVKPANLLLDTRGQVWVADFGLAKLVDHQGVTETGHILGTLQYMAPECLHGEADARSDVYGLGATLYELLTLETPFDAESPVRLMKQIAESDPPPPRLLNPNIPRDLETIVLKAMAREPGRRYASAELLADDLRAFLDDRPIRARRESWASRGWRWCRRNPAVAGLSSTTAAALVLAAIIGWVGYARTHDALEAEAKKRDEAERASARLEANLKLSLEAFEKVFDAAGGEEFRPGFGARPGGPPPGRPFGMEGEAADKATVLEAVLTFYDKFAEQNATHPRLRFEAAKAHRRVGEVHQWLGREQRAVASSRRAAELLDGLAEEYPDDEAIRFEALLAYGLAPDSAPWTETQLVRAAQRGRGGSNFHFQWAQGLVHLKLGRVHEQGGRVAEAAVAYRDAIDQLAAESGREREPRPPNIVIGWATAHQRLAKLLAETGRLPEARQVLEGAADKLRPLARSFSGGGRNPSRFAWEPCASLLQQLATVLDRLGDSRKAQEVGTEADEYRKLAQNGPPFRFPPVEPPRDRPMRLREGGPREGGPREGGPREPPPPPLKR